MFTDPRLVLYFEQQATLFASAERAFAAPDLLAGITSGPGNQGTANTATLILHAGTGLGQLSVPRSLSNGRQQSI